MKTLFLSALVSVYFSTFADAQSVNFNRWIVANSEAEGTGKRICLITRSYDDKTALSIMNHGSNKFQISIENPKWISLTEKDKRAITTIINFNNNGGQWINQLHTQSKYSVDIGLNKPGVMEWISAEKFSDFSENAKISDSFDLFMDDREIGRYSLIGSADALDAFAECVADINGDNDPFKK